MNIKNLLFLLFCFILGACSDDKTEPGGDPNRPEPQAWIEDTMRKHYFWLSDIPNADKLDYSKAPKDFFTSMLSNKDGKTRENGHHYYSYIEEANASRSLSQTHYSYGFEFMGIYRDDVPNAIMALVMYVVKGSPAAEAGLKRGDWIIEIDGVPIYNNTFGLLAGSKASTFTIRQWNEQAQRPVTVEEKIDIASARSVEDNPVFKRSVVQSPKGKKVGYLVYNHFTDGTTSNPKKYDNELWAASDFYHTEDVKEFVLDLRYNNGGLLSSALILCSMLIPENNLGQDCGYLKYNDDRKSTFKTSKPLPAGAKNLNLKRLYVLVSGNSASASEMVINTLSPYMEVIVIGQQTEGKNVGSLAYTDKSKQWEMHPIVCEIYNSQNSTDYANGFIPSVILDEESVPAGEGYVRIVEVLPLGDENERLLHAALQMIDGTDIAGRSIDASDTKAYKKTNIYSIDRKATNGVIINE